MSARRPRTCGRTPSRRPGGAAGARDAGNALVLVIAILAALIAIGGPFALSMRLQERTARGRSAALRADLAARAARDIAIRRLLDAHPDLERARAVAEGTLADSPEDWTDAAELQVALADLPGGASFAVRDARGTMLAAEIEDEQGKLDLNSAPGDVLGNLLGVTVLVRAIGESVTDIEVEDASRFYRDGNPETIDGLLAIGSELVAYRDIDGNLFTGCERGAFFSAPEVERMRHPAGALVRDARGKKLALTPFWLEAGAYRPFERVAAIRDIASWQLVDACIAGLLETGYTVADLRELGLGVPEGVAGAPSAGGAPPAPEPAGASITADIAFAGRDGASPEELVEEVIGRFVNRYGRREGEKRFQELVAAMRGPAEEGARRFIEQAERRLAQRADFERRYFRDARELAARLRDVGDLETFRPRELEELRSFLTVSATRPAEWAGGALVLSRVEPSPDRIVSVLALGVPLAEALAGAVARVEAGGAVEYRRVVAVENDRRRLQIYPQLDGTYEAETARVWVAPRHAVNINTAPRRVLEAILTGLEIRAARSKDAERDFVTPREAAAIAARIVAAPVPSFEALSVILDDAVTAGEISPMDRAAVRLAAMDPGHPSLRASAVPVCFRSGGTATVIATGIVNDKAGNELARRTIREVVTVSPPREAVVRFDSQADFYYEAGDHVEIPGRGGNLVETHPRAIRAREDGGAIRYPDRSHAPAIGDIRAKTGEVVDEGEWVEHYRDDLEGKDVGTGIAAGDVLPKWRDPTEEAGAIDAGAFGSITPAEWPGEVLAPGMIELWIRPSAVDGRRVIFDAGQGDFTDRVALWLENGEIVLRVADGALPIAAGAAGADPWLDAAEVRAPFAPQAETWYHVCAMWKGTRAGELALFVDGLPVGEHRSHARLASAVIPSATALVLDRPLPRGTPAQGALQVGTEVVEYTGYGGGTSVTIPQGGRGARGSRARAHAAGTPVQVWGYRELCYPQVNLGPAAQALAAANVPNPVETTRPDGSLWRGGGRLVHPVPRGTPIALLRVGMGGPIGPTENRLPAIPCPSDPAGGAPATLAAAGFPPRGFILIEHELAYYEGLSPDAFENVRRFVSGLTPAPISTEEFAPPGIPWQQRPPHHYYGFELVQLASIEIDDATDYPASWWVELDDEWFRYWKPTAIDWGALNPTSGFDPAAAANVLITGPYVADVIPGRGNTAVPGRASIFGGRTTDAWRTWDGLRARMDAGAMVATGAPVPAWALNASLASPDNHFHLAMDWARAIEGTQPADHAPGTLARIPYALTRPYAGTGDQATLVDAQDMTPRRVPVRVRRGAWSDNLLASLPIPAAAAPLAHLVTLEDLLPATRPFRPAAGARLLKHPTGDLALFPPQALTFGALRPGGELPSAEPAGAFAGRMDEIRVARDPFAEDAIADIEEAIAGARGLEHREAVPVFRRARSFLHRAERGLRPLWDPQTAQPRPLAAASPVFAWAPFFARYADQVNASGALVLLDEEALGLVRSSGASAEAKRGLLGRAPAPHSDEAIAYVPPFPAWARLRAIGGERNEKIEHTGRAHAFRERGYLALDPGDGAGVRELLPYEGVAEDALVRPLDDRLRGAFRAAFGTEETSFEEGDLGFDFPFRHFDRYQPQLESRDAVFWEARWSPPGAAHGTPCLFRGIEWDEREIGNGDVDVKVLARVDGAPAWDAQPTNAPGGLWLFDDPKAANEMRVAGRGIELRVHFTFKKGAYRRGTWKETARVDAVRVRYVAPIVTLAVDEVE